MKKKNIAKIVVVAIILVMLAFVVFNSEDFKRGFNGEAPVEQTDD